MRGDPEPEHDDQQRDERQPEQDGAAHRAADAQDEDRDRGDRHDHHRVDDPLDDDRAEDRRPADAFALAERVAAVQLAEPRRQDVVGEVADVGVAEDAPVAAAAAIGASRARQRAPRAPMSMRRVTSMTAIQAGDAVRRTANAASRSTEWMRTQIANDADRDARASRAAARSG